MKNKNKLSKLTSIVKICCIFLGFTIEVGCTQSTINKNNNFYNIQTTAKDINNGNSIIFDKNSFDTTFYIFDGTSYVSERVLFPATINGKKLILEMSIDRPADNNKYPVIILTHGRSGPFPSKRNFNACKYFDKVKWYFLKEHLVVAQLVRRGEGLSEGSNMDEYKMTPIDSGKEMVKDIEQALIYMKFKPYVIKKKFVIGGHSQGGWAALAAASADLKGVAGIINFSGATNYRRQPWSRNWPWKANSDFTRDCKKLAQASRVPSLWIYGDSEPLHTRKDIEGMYFAYKHNKLSGHSKLLLLPNVKHDTISNEAQELWIKPLHDFLIENGIVNLVP